MKSTDDLRSLLAETHAAVAPRRDGRIADYIPELASVDPDLFGIALCTYDGEVIGVGDCEEVFSLQSVVKPFLYASALAQFGAEAVHRRVGVEPTGAAFDSIVRVETATNRPHNPMVNAGAIAVTGLFASGAEAERSDHLLEMMAAFAGRDELHIDAPTYLSERATGHRNRAIAYLMRQLGMLEAPVEQTLELYFQACSVAVSCRDLAIMGATLANGGRNPLTDQDTLPARHVRDVLAVMSTCGLYDESGRFAHRVGLAAKSGVSGAIVAVASERYGIAVYSPRLDATGSSVRGQAALEIIGRELGLHMFDTTRARRPRADGADSPGDLRSAVETAMAAALAATGGQVASYIPELGEVAPDRLAIAVATVDGSHHAAGDVGARFTLQATANPFTYAMAIETAGFVAVHDRVGLEPSGNPFNAIVLEPTTNRPYNALGNAGAITIAGMLPGTGAADRLKRLQAMIAGFAGCDRIDLDMAVFLSERSSGDRNRAIAHMLRNYDRIDDVDGALDLYFQQCSLKVDIISLARMGATLANGGVCPTTTRSVVRPETVKHVMTAMCVCGMHDGSGQFAFDVGVPAKSGVSGAIVGAVPGRIGVAVYSPRVDAKGASVAGLAAMQSLSDSLGLSLFTAPR